jgi:stearoyl-CoA desaturase (delta-9 desaturase)
MKLKSGKPINWGTAIFLISYQVILFLTLPFYFYYSTLHVGTIISAFVLLWLTGLSITAGYHRYFAHRSYKAHPVVEFFLLFFGTMAVQSSVIRWAFEHRLHHAHVDTDKDPYCIKKGFWYAHFLWMMEKLQPIDPKIVPDLMKNKMVAFQHAHYKPLMVLTNFMAFLVVGFFFQDYWGAFFIAVWIRIFILQHCTWFINSLAHTWGSKQFSLEQSAVDNYVIALLTFGEGYHNYHHTFANDYRNGIRWFHFDPTKWLIWTLSKLGLATGLKMTDPLVVKKRMVIEHKDFLIETLSKYWKDGKCELEKQVLELSERILKSISEFSQLKDKHKEAQNNSEEMTSLQQVQAEISELQKSLSKDWRQCK